MLSNVAYGAESDDIYLRKDVFEAKMNELIAEIRLGNERMRHEIDERFNKLDKKIDNVQATLDKKIDNVHSELGKEIAVLAERTESTRTIVFFGLAFLGIIIVFAPDFLQRIKEIRKPSITLEDVKKLIEENNTKIFEMNKN